jgi:hypothetical protein
MKERINKVISKEEKEVSLKEAIQSLEEFDYCFKLSTEEEKLYKEVGYLFPHLRPEGSFALGKNIKNRILF